MVRSLTKRRPGLVLLLAAVALAGCSTATETGQTLVDSRGNHVAGFFATHPSSALQDATPCRSCHGDDLRGGISGVSCLNAACHHDPVPSWAFPGVHGAEAKKAPGGSGFASCQICHGIDFAARLGQPPLNCLDCHGANAPHPVAPWRTAGGLNHDNTDPRNAPVCAACHFPGSPNNPPGHPATPAPPGTPPGCFNDTLCHGAAAPHPLGAVWNFPAVGGANFHGTSAKANLKSCQICHGTPGTNLFEGGIAPTACSFCHDDANAHPTDWQGVRVIGGATITHRTSTNPTDPAGQCAICHKVDGPGTGPAPAAPSCFSDRFTNADGQDRNCHANGP